MIVDVEKVLRGVLLTSEGKCPLEPGVTAKRLRTYKQKTHHWTYMCQSSLSQWYPGILRVGRGEFLKGGGGDGMRHLAS